MKKTNLIKCLALLIFFINSSSASELTKRNDLRTLFTNNEAIIYEINIRTFGAVDSNKNGIIDIYDGEESGTFLNAIPKLREIRNLGFNTLYLMPITKVGKLKALGTAGSLYAMDSFNTINPQFDDLSDDLSVYDEAKEFIKEAHALNFRVIIDMPCAGSYDFTLKDKNLFMTDKNGQTIVPSDWTDVRLFKVYNNDKKTLNRDVLDGYKSFVDMVQELGADGIRADVAGIKPKEFWQELISYARRNDNEFLFLAEASPAWKNPVKSQHFYTSVEHLLQAGFDGYYGEYGDFSRIYNAKDFHKIIKKERKIIKKFDNKKSTIASFVTHDQQSPTINGNKGRSDLITWLSVTLPVNSFFLDGYLTGDDFLYPYKDKKAEYTETDDDYYFAHKGKMDIFNFSRAPQGNFPEIYDEVKDAVKFKNWSKDILKNAPYKPIETGNQDVFGFSRKDKNNTLIVIGNLSEQNSHKIKINTPSIKNSVVIPIKHDKEPKYGRKSITTTLKPYEIQVYLFSKKN